MPEKDYFGAGNVGRSTTIIRSNELPDGNQPFPEVSLKPWKGREQDFNGNALFRVGADAQMLARDQARSLFPFLNFDDVRFPIMGAAAQRRGAA